MNKFLEIPREFLSYDRAETHNNSEKVTIMIYNDNFRKMYSQFPYYRYFHMIHVFISAVIILLSYLYVYEAFFIDKIIPIF